MLSDATAVRRALAEGRAVVLPNPAPLTCVVTATRPEAVNLAKRRPAGQAVALWAHHPDTLGRLAGLLDLGPATLRLARRLLDEELVTLLVPVREPGSAPPWLAPATQDGWTLLFGALWKPLADLLEPFPVLYVSSANRTGQLPSPTPADAAVAFGPDVPVLADPVPADTAATRRATTTVRLDSDGRMDVHRHGAQDGGHGGAEEYLAHLGRTYGG
ncbi:hypothetical protein ACFV4G_40650 [Kitasatospora sp. NPDC059747]|uniref:hypothetical protein n=1 Tax=Kitasatospora sp. NPDC059747 TaxID=3346930 RepID=UPI00366A3C10